VFKDQPEDGPIIGPKHATAIIILYDLIKYKVVYDYIILYLIFNSTGMSHLKILSHMSEQACSIPFEVEVYLSVIYPLTPQGVPRHKLYI
jgi:hypothetical protein